MTNPKNGTSTPLSFKTSNLFSTSVTFDVWFVWNFWLPKWRIPISRQIPPGSGGIRFEVVLSFTQEPTTAFLKFTSVYVQLCWMEEKNVFVNIAWTVIYSYFQWVNLHHANKFLSPKIQDCWIYRAVAYYLQHARNAKKPHAKNMNCLHMLLSKGKLERFEKEMKWTMLWDFNAFVRL